MRLEHENEQGTRVLARMHRVLSHDLPNQIVAIQSLLQLLEMEETSRLSDDGRECVQRLRRVARKAAGQARFLREMGRLGSSKPSLATMTLASLVREIDNEIRQLFPAATVRCRLTTEHMADIQPFPADPRRLVLACTELTRFLLERLPVAPCVLQVAGRTRAEGIEISGELAPADGAAGMAMPPRPRLREHFEIVLAEEMLAHWGGRLSDVCEEKGCSRFTVLLSLTTGHG